MFCAKYLTFTLTMFCLVLEKLIDATTLKPFEFDIYNGDKKRNQQRYEAIGEV
jgi:hypothetical protein